VPHDEQQNGEREFTFGQRFKIAAIAFAAGTFIPFIGPTLKF